MMRVPLTMRAHQGASSQPQRDPSDRGDQEVASELYVEEQVGTNRERGRGRGSERSECMSQH